MEGVEVRVGWDRGKQVEEGVQHGEKDKEEET